MNRAAPEPDVASVPWRPPPALIGIVALAVLLASATLTHVFVAPTIGDERQDEVRRISPGASTIVMVLVQVDSQRLVGEGADGSFVTLELEGASAEPMVAAAHEFMHGSSARVVRVAYRRSDERRYATAIVEGPRDFPGVSRPAPRPMSRADFDSFDERVTREAVIERVGPPHVPGMGQEWEGRPADCFTWHAVTGDRQYRLCFDQSSAPRLLGRDIVEQ